MLQTVMIAQYLAITIVVAELIYVLFQRPSEMQVILITMIISTLMMQVGYIMEITAVDQDAAMAGAMVGYIGKPFSFLTTFVFVYRYCGYRMPRKLFIALIAIQAVFTVAVFTNSCHYLFYSSVGFDRSRTFSPLILGHGVLYYAYMASVVLYFAANLVLSVKEYRRSTTVEAKRQIFYLFGLLASGVLGYMVFLAGLTKGYDATMAGCFVGTLFLLILFFKYRLFDTLTLAKEQALYDAVNGLVVLDQRNDVVYRNAMVERLIAQGLSVDEVLALPEPETRLFMGESVYEVKRKTVADKGRTFGQTIEISDITDSYNYSSRLERDVESRTKEIQHIQRTIVASIANIVEARDDSTGLHVKRTSAYVRIVAEKLREMGLHRETLTGEYITRLEDVSPLHDIGKLSISDSILCKPGKLTAEEYEVIKTHTTLGVGIIEKTMRGVETDEYVSMAEDVALYHHERWDGSGYPAGLSGELIPLSARIMAIADVYDAVCSLRCYKPALSKTEARGIIRDGRGSHFDPDVVDAFMRGLAEIERI